MEYTGTTDSILFGFWFEEVEKRSIIILDNVTFQLTIISEGTKIDFSLCLS